MPEPAVLADRLWTPALVTLPALLIFADHRWTDVVFMFLAGPSWPVQIALGVIAAMALARLALGGGAVVVVAALVASQLVAHRHGEHADLGAFLMAAFQVMLVIRVVEALRDGWRGAPSASWTTASAREQALTYAFALAAGLLAWWSGLAAWLFARLGADDSGPVVGMLALLVAGRVAVLLHELGHALVARRRLGAGIALRVGRRGKPLRVSAGGIEVRLHLLDVLDESGAVELDGSWASVDDMIAIALAGPLASLAGLVAALPILAVLPTGDGPWHALAWWFAVWSAVGVLNLLPFRFRVDRDAPVTASDGRQLLDALAVRWALR
jgi:hypothetical protein